MWENVVRAVRHDGVVVSEHEWYATCCDDLADWGRYVEFVVYANEIRSESGVKLPIPKGHMRMEFLVFVLVTMSGVALSFLLLASQTSGRVLAFVPR